MTATSPGRTAGVAIFLRSLLGAGMSFVIVGSVIAWTREGRLPHGAVPLDALLAGLSRLDGAALSSLGVLVLLATPPLALVWLGGTFARAADWRFAGVSTALLVLVALGLVAAWLGETTADTARLDAAGLGTEVAVFFAAAAAGALGVQVGLGGGAFLVPILSGLLGIPMKLAIAAGAVSVVVNSVVGTSTYLRDRIPNVRLGLLLELPSLVGAIVGGLLVAIVAPDLLRGIFAAVLLGLALRTVTQRRTAHVEPGEADPLGVAGSYHDAAIARDVSYHPQRLSLGAWGALVGGTLSGLLGLAGGVVTMPVMLNIMRMPVKAAAATSVFMGGMTVSASAYIYYVHRLIDLSIVIPAVVGIQIGSRSGALLSRRLAGVVLERVLALVLAALGVLLVLQLLGIGPPAS